VSGLDEDHTALRARDILRQMGTGGREPNRVVAAGYDGCRGFDFMKISKQRAPARTLEGVKHDIGPALRGDRSQHSREALIVRRQHAAKRGATFGVILDHQRTGCRAAQAAVRG